MGTSKTSRPLPAPQLAEVSLSGGISVLTDESLFAACATRIAFTSRHGGTSATPYAALNLSLGKGDEDARVYENRRLLLDALGVGETLGCLVSPVQVHGTHIVSVGDDLSAARGEAQAGADGVLCTRTGIPALLCFADCAPVVVVAPGGAFCVAHAGWRGALGGIAGKALKQLCAASGTAPRDCNAYIGPHIGSCCYETSAEVLAQFVEAYGSSCDAGNRHLSLCAAVTADLVAAGADIRRVIGTARCTSCEVDRYYSYRAEGGVTGRHGAFAIRLERGGK